MKKSNGLMIVAALIAVGITVSERLFPAPVYVMLPAAFLAVVCLLVGFAGSRTALSQSRSAEPERGWHYYLVLMVTAAVSVVIGLIIFSRIYSDIPLSKQVPVGVTIFLVAAMFFSWDVFLRRRALL